jgi:hypothetical protein
VSRRVVIAAVAVVLILALVGAAWRAHLGPFASSAAQSPGQGASTGQVTGAQGAFAKLPAQQIVNRSLATAARARSVRYTAIMRGSTSTVVDRGQAGPSYGLQTVLGDGVALAARLIRGTVYTEGNASALVVALNIPRASAERLAGHWLAITRRDSVYPAAVSGIALPSTMQQIVMSGALTNAGTMMMNGQQVVQIVGSGQSGSKAVLWISTATHLPVQYSESRVGLSTVVVFGNWGHPVTVVAPRGAIALASVYPHL